MEEEVDDGYIMAYIENLLLSLIRVQDLLNILHADQPNGEYPMGLQEQKRFLILFIDDALSWIHELQGNNYADIHLDYDLDNQNLNDFLLKVNELIGKDDDAIDYDSYL